MSHQPGWYDDPSNPGVALRYHDGDDWTRNVTRKPEAAPIPAAPAHEDPEDELDAPDTTRRRWVMLLGGVVALALVVGGAMHLTKDEETVDGGIPSGEALPGLSIPVMPQVPAEAPGPVPTGGDVPVTGGATRLEFAAAASVSCSKTATTLAAFDMRSLDDPAQSPARFPRAVADAYTLLATEVAQMEAPMADKVAIDDGMVESAAMIAQDAGTLAAEADKQYAEVGYPAAAKVVANMELVSNGSAAQTMMRFTQEYGITCTATP